MMVDPIFARLPRELVFNCLTYVPYHNLTRTVLQTKKRLLLQVEYAELYRDMLSLCGTEIRFGTNVYQFDSKSRWSNTIKWYTPARNGWVLVASKYQGQGCYESLYVHVTDRRFREVISVD